MHAPLQVILTGGIFHPFHATSSHMAQVMAGFGVATRIFDDVEAGLDCVRRESPALLTVNLLRWRMAGEKYDADRDEWAFELSSEGQQTISRHVEGGGGLFGLHTASICFDTWEGWGELLGGRWVWNQSYHPPLGPIQVTPTACPHPITAGVADFRVRDEVYTRLDLADDVQALLEAAPGDGAPPQPLLWARTCGRGRVAYDALGHDVASLAQPAHARAWTRAALWAMGRDEELTG
jgi:hypothetical protein